MPNALTLASLVKTGAEDVVAAVVVAAGVVDAAEVAVDMAVEVTTEAEEDVVTSGAYISILIH